MLRSLFAVGCTVAASALIAGSAAAQGGFLSGAIYDPGSRTGLAGAEVRIAGTSLVAITTADGRYTIADVPAGMHKVEIARSGYRTFSLPEVRIGAADTAHVYVVLGLAPAARDAACDPGPMYIIDGVILACGSAPPRIEPATIESVEVIKGDMARRMYGDAAGTGVIMITTRKAPDRR
jgi:hypothetical protein